MSTFLVVRHTRADEELGRAELITSTPVRRAAPLAATIVLGTVANAVLALLVTAGFIVGGLGGVALGVIAGTLGPVVADVAADNTSLAELIGRLVPGAALVLAALPAATALLAWGLLTAGLVIGQLGDLLRLPDWLQAASPFSHSAAMPLEDFDAATAGILLAVAVALAGTATVLYRWRDLRA